MIDHIFIKNYKAFKKENVPLDKNTLLIGTNASGKTTVLEALDLFFNNVFHYDSVRDTERDVVIEVHIEEERYRKVYKAPDYRLSYEDCIGRMYDINHIKFLYVQKDINTAKLLNDILSINLTEKQDPHLHSKIFKVFDYIDGTLGNSNFDIFKIETKYEMNIDQDITFTKEEYARIISNVTYPYMVLGIDNFEDNFNTDMLKKFTQYTYQTILTTNDKQVIKQYDYYIHGLYRTNVKEEFETIKNQALIKDKTYLLVEGKYDVAWFEKALHLLGKQKDYRVIPCGGFGNIEYVKKQLVKEGFKTIVITDGDVEAYTGLKREIIELYGDLSYVNMRFDTNFKKMPRSKREFFRQIRVKDDVVKKVLSSWAKKHLVESSEFVQEVSRIIKEA